MTTSQRSLSTPQAPILGHRVFGQGREKVLLLHHWMGDASSYDPLMPYLDPRTYTYVFADLRGYGMSRHLTGAYSVEEVSADALRLADSLGWERFHVVGHSMTGMVAQRLAVDDWVSGAKRLKSVVAITPVSADGYPADDGTKQFLWDLIHQQALSEQGFSMLTGQRLSALWAREQTTRHFQTSTAEALKGYYRMWLETDFSEDVRRTTVETPILVIGGRQDLPGFQEDHLRRTLGTWFQNAAFTFITDSGHFPMVETPVYLASPIERFLDSHQTSNENAPASEESRAELLACHDPS
ncbi:MAG: alpha/beta hydrolase [Nitrospira sp.]|nr:alpha/beta hydrolase [Nitrospira sp.]